MQTLRKRKEAADSLKTITAHCYAIHYVLNETDNEYRRQSKDVLMI